MSKEILSKLMGNIASMKNLEFGNNISNLDKNQYVKEKFNLTNINMKENLLNNLKFEQIKHLDKNKDSQKKSHPDIEEFPNLLPKITYNVYFKCKNFPYVNEIKKYFKICAIESVHLSLVDKEGLSIYFPSALNEISFDFIPFTNIQEESNYVFCYGGGNDILSINQIAFNKSTKQYIQYYEEDKDSHIKYQTLIDRIRDQSILFKNANIIATPLIEVDYNEYEIFKSMVVPKCSQIIIYYEL